VDSLTEGMISIRSAWESHWKFTEVTSVWMKFPINMRWTQTESVAMLRKFTKHALLYTPDPVCIVNNFNFKNAQNAYGVL